MNDSKPSWLFLTTNITVADPAELYDEQCVSRAPRREAIKSKLLTCNQSALAIRSGENQFTPDGHIITIIYFIKKLSP